MFTVNDTTSESSWLVYDDSLTSLMKQLNVKKTFLYNNQLL